MVQLGPLVPKLHQQTPNCIIASLHHMSRPTPTDTSSHSGCGQVVSRSPAAFFNPPLQTCLSIPARRSRPSIPATSVHVCDELTVCVLQVAPFTYVPAPSGPPATRRPAPLSDARPSSGAAIGTDGREEGLRQSFQNDGGGQGPMLGNTCPSVMSPRLVKSVESRAMNGTL